MNAVTAGRVATPADTREFHFRMAIVFVLIAFGGFTPTYWAPVVGGRFHAPPIAHIHGALLFSWTLFYLAQTAWVRAGRVPRHRAWGLAGISLFTLLLCSIVVFKLTLMKLDEAHGFGDASRRFAAIIFLGVPVMATVFAAAIANVSRPEIHKRLMYALMCGMMVPAIARVFLVLLAPPGASAGGPPPPFVALPPTGVAALLLAIGIVHDWRRGVRWHPAYVYGGAAVLLTDVIAVLISGTDAWMRIARAIESVAG